MSGNGQDYYRILDVRPDATQAEIKEAWLFSVKAFHPDKFARSSQRQQAVAQQRTKAINEAYEILSDATRRANYDRQYARRTSAENAPPPQRATPPPEPTRTASSVDASANDNSAQRTQTRKTDPPPEQNRNESLRAAAFGAGLYIPWLIAAAMLVSAAVEKHPYSFYMLLRWICCAIFAWSAFIAHEKNRPFWAWGFGALAALYNPIVLVHLSRGTWISVNWFTVGVIIVAGVAFLPRRAQIWVGAAAALVVIALGLWQLQPVTPPRAAVPKASPQVSESPPATLGSWPNDPDYRVTARHGLVTVVDVKSNRIVASTTLQRWGVAAPTQDKLRHVALDLTAAAVAGNGGREHTVAPDLPVYTLEDFRKHKSPEMTATVEHGSAFFLLSDTQRNDSYDALIGMGKTEFQPASSPSDSLNFEPTPIPRAIPRAMPVAPIVDTSAAASDSQSGNVFDQFDVSRARAKTYQITGTVLQITDTMIAVQKGMNRWEINRGPKTRVTGGELKVGVEVTITYAISATTVK